MATLPSCLLLLGLAAAWPLLPLGPAAAGPCLPSRHHHDPPNLTLAACPARYRPPLMPHLPSSLKKAIEQCWRDSPELRPTAAQLVDMLTAIQEAGEQSRGTSCKLVHQGLVWLAALG